MARTDDPFAVVHRGARRRAAATTLASTLALAAVVAFAWVVPSYAAPAQTPRVDAAPIAAPVDPAAAGGVAGAEAGAEADAVVGASPGVEPGGAGAVGPEPGAVASGSGAAQTGAAAPGAVSSGVGAQHPVALPIGTPVSGAPAPVPAPGVGEPGTRSYGVDIDATGYQAELDECLWVRMDIGAVAPIVGAHNTCGGDIVLDMATGDVVRLAGEGLDGEYVVVGARDARKGQNAFEATDGMTATLILQTCHWEGDGVRLVALVPA